MSLDISTGRHNKRVATSNLGEAEEDDPEFVPFDEEEEVAGPRGPYDPLSVLSVDMCAGVNNKHHNTDVYRNHAESPLVVRRGKPFEMLVEFSRVVGHDDFQLEFRIGSGMVMMVNFGDRPRGSSWRGQIDDCSTPTVRLTVTPSADAVAGKFRTFVGVPGLGGMHYTRKPNTDFYLLFNAWCPEDSVYMADAASRYETVMNEYGLIFMGTAASYSGRPWLYAQFEEGILDACIHILDRCRMPISERGNVIKVTRQASEMINAQDNDNGVLVGNWGKTFPDGTSPLKWTGSKSILEQYIHTGVSVRYGQCWVFAAVFNTFLRCMGIPARVVTNFNSAHDNDGNVKTDILYTPSGAKDPRTKDSIWNFHCWNEVFMTRTDLPGSLRHAGWQCVDATPQENSDGFYRCGPASVAAVKDGQVCHPYDTPFVFAEVNSDVIHSTRDKYGGLTTFYVEKHRVGLLILTKAVAQNTEENITHTYKYPEGSPQDEQTMNTAESLGCSRDHSDLSPPSIMVKILTNETVMKGDTVHLEMEFTNQGETTAEFQGSIKGTVVFYTGVEYSNFLMQPINLHIAPSKVEKMLLNVPREYYMPSIGYQNSLQFSLSGQSAGTPTNSDIIVTLKNQSLNFKLDGVPKRDMEMFVEVSFVNPFNYPLTNVNVGMEGDGLFYYKKHHFGSIEANGTMTWSVPYKPWRTGVRYIFALMDCSELTEVWGILSVFIDE